MAAVKLQRFLPILLLCTVALTLPHYALAGFTVYYPFTVDVEYVRPPIYFKPVGVDYVDTVLGVNATSASVTVNITVNYIIARVFRAAVYWSNFSRNPFATGELIPLSGNWSWVNGYVLLNITGNGAGFGGESVALVNVTLPENYTRIYIEYDFRIAYAYTAGWVDTVYLLSDNNSIYTVGVRYNPSYYPIVYVQVWEYNGSWYRLANSIAYGSTANINDTFYDLTSFFDASSYRLGLLSGTNSLVEGQGDRGDVVGVGIGGYIDTQNALEPLAVYYDLLIVTVDKPPYWVNVTGLQPGWSVYIVDDRGNVVASGTAGYDGIASIDFWQVKFIPNATIVVYDSYGNIVAAQRFDWIVGGDVYALYNPLAGGIRMTVLESQNNSTETFTAGLRLVDYRVVKGSVNVLNVSLVSQASTPATSISIVGGNVVSSYSGPTVIYPGYEGFITLYFDVTYNTSVVLDLEYVYGVGGVTVRYPLTIEIHVYDPKPHVDIRGYRAPLLGVLEPLPSKPTEKVVGGEEKGVGKGQY